MHGRIDKDYTPDCLKKDKHRKLTFVLKIGPINGGSIVFSTDKVKQLSVKSLSISETLIFSG
jgi:hypothetical protein